MAKHPGGRPPKYNAKFHPKWAKALSQNGKTDIEIAEEMEISDTTLYNWKNKYPEFVEAIKDGKQEPDDLVEQSLFKRATGFEYEEEVVENRDGKMVLTRKVKKEQAPDTAAAFIWLKNRRPEKWRDKKEIKAEVTNDSAIALLNELREDLIKGE